MGWGIFEPWNAAAALGFQGNAGQRVSVTISGPDPQVLSMNGPNVLDSPASR